MSSIGRQLSFAAGEVSPGIAARPDLIKFQTGLSTCRNFIVLPSGGLASRPGTSWSGPVKDHSRKVRLWPFVYDKDWRYILEFGHLYLRFHKDGKVALSQAFTTGITAITNANPAVMSVATIDIFNSGDEIRIDGVLGMPEINGRHYKVTKLTSTTYSLQDQATGANIDSTSFGVYSSGGTAGKPIESATAFDEVDLDDLQFSQHGNVLTIAHPTKGIWELIRQSATVLILRKAVFGTSLNPPINVSAAGGPTGSKTLRWKITAVYAEGLEETLPGREGGLGIDITGITNGNPAKVTTGSPHGLTTGDEIYIESVIGMTEVNGRNFRVTRIDGSNFFLDNEDATEHGVYMGGGKVYKTWAERSSIGDPTPTSPVILTCDVVPGAIEYNIYRERDGIYGWIGSTSKVNALGLITFADIGYTPDMLDNPPIARYPMIGSDRKPYAVGAFQHRRYFGGTGRAPEGIQASKVGFISNFFTYVSVGANDPFAAVIVGRTMGRIRHFLDAGKLLIFTESGEWVVDGDADGVVSALSFNARQFSQYGSDRIPPLIVGGVPIFVTRGRKSIRDLVNAADGAGGVSADLSIFSRHLLDGYTIQAIAYAQVPQSILWIVRNDGKLLGVTIIREQELLGWHRHDTDGVIEDVASMQEADPEGSEEDRVYLVVSRTLPGGTRRYVERLGTFKFQDDPKLITVDASVTYDGTNSTVQTVSITGGTTWSDTELLTLVGGNGKTFEASEVDSGYIIKDSSGDSVRFRITEYVNSTTVKGFSHKTVPASLRGTPVTTWIKGRKTIYGLWHLEGKPVAVYADGYVIANPLNPKFGSALIVSSGKVTLPDWYGIVTVGLPFVGDIETLSLDSVQSTKYADSRKLAVGAAITVERSGAFLVGGRRPESDTDFNHFEELRVHTAGQGWETPKRLTGTYEVGFGGSWNDSGNLWIRLRDPVPLRVLGIRILGMTGGG